MKVSEVIKLLSAHKPDDEIIAVWFEKPNFDFPEDYELTLTDKAWSEICTEFDSWDNADRDIANWIADAVLEHSEVNDVAQDDN